MQQYLTLEEAAKQLAMAPDELREMAKKKTIRAFQDRGSWRFRSQDIEELARKRGASSDPELGLGEARKPAPKKPQDSDLLPVDFALDEGDEVQLGKHTPPPGPRSGRSGKLPKAGSDSDVRLVLEGDIDLGNPDPKKAEPKSGPRSPRSSGRRTTPAGDSGVRLVPEKDPSDSDVKVVPSSKDSGVGKKSSKSPSDSDIRLQDAGAPPGKRKGETGPITEEIDLDAEEQRLADEAARKGGGKGRKLTQHAPTLPTESPFELSEPDLDLGGKSGKSKSPQKPSKKKKEDDSSSEFELIPFPEGKGAGLGSGDIPLLSDDDDDAVDLGAEVSGPNSGNSGINVHRPQDSGISLEGGSSDEIEFELSLDAGNTPKPAAKSSPKSGPKAKAPAPAGEDSSSEFELSLDDSSPTADSDSDSEFELSLDDSAGSLELKKDDSGSDSEFELSLDDEGGLAADEDAGDIFEETNFDVPSLEDESGSEAVALEDSSSETDLEGVDSDFEISMDDDSSTGEESDSQVVDVGEEAEADDATVARPRKKGKAAAAAVVEEEEVVAEDEAGFDDLDEDKPKKGKKKPKAEPEEEEDEESEEDIPATVAAPAEWGALPAVILFPTVLVMFVVGIMGFEVLRGMWGFHRPSVVGKPVVDVIARQFDENLPK